MPSRTSGKWWKSLLANAALVIGSLLVMVLILEVAFRALGYSKLFDVYSKPSIIWEYDELMGWRNAPNVAVTYTGPKPFPIEYSNEVRTNSLGLRRDAELPPDAAALKKILVLGDSRVAALEVAYPDTFTHLLEQRFERELGEKVLVLNAGVRGYGTDQNYLYYTSRGRQLDPDLVVFFHSGNDPRDNITLHRMKRPFGKSALAFRDDGSLEVLNNPVPDYPLCSAFAMRSSYDVVRIDSFSQRVLCRIQIALLDQSVLFSFVTTTLNNQEGLIRALENLVKPSKDDMRSRTGSRDFEVSHTTRIIQALNDTVTTDGREFLLMLPDYLEFQVKLEELAGVAVQPFDVAGEETQWKNDGHFNEYGHRLVAERTFEPIRDALLRAGTVRAAGAD